MSQEGSEKLSHKGKARRTLIAGGLMALLGKGDTPEKQPTGSFSERVQAAQEIEQNGITSFQRRAYKPGISDLLARGLDPYGYVSFDTVNRSEDIIHGVEAVIQGFRNDRNEQRMQEIEARLEREGEHIDRAELRRHKSRMDAWHMYLGMPQQHNTFSISRFQPSRHQEDRYYYKLNNFIDVVRDSRRLAETAAYEYSYNRPIADLLDDLENHSENGRLVYGDVFMGLMGGFTLSQGQDQLGHYISYYDRWDLDGSIEGEKGVVGQPFEIYDRIYYDPETLQPLDPQPRS